MKKIETPEDRAKLKPQRKPYYARLKTGLYLGYRRTSAAAGSWSVRYYVGGQRYREATLGIADDFGDADPDKAMTHADARLKALATPAEAAGRPKAKRSRPITVADVMESYLAYIRREKRTFLGVKSRNDAFIKPALGTMPIAELTTKHIIDFRNRLSETPRRQRTKAGSKQQYFPAAESDEEKRKRRVSANLVISTLKSALNKSWQESELDGVVQSDREWRRAKLFKNVVRARPRFLSFEEARKLVAACDPAFAKLVQAALFSGCRYGELCRLRVGDFEADVLEIHTTKSGQPRTVELTDEGVAFFRSLCADRTADEFMLLRANGKPWVKHAQCYPMKLACQRAKIPHAGFHQLRHSYASQAVMAGLELKLVADQLGHSSPVMTQRFYAHLSRDHVRKAVRERGPKFDFGMSS